MISNICKLAERLVLARMQRVLEENGAYHDSQTGFRDRSEIQDSLLMLYKHVLKRPSRADPRIVIAIDVKKAFDLVSRTAMLTNTEKHRIQGQSLCFVRAFLKDRKFRLKFGSTKNAAMPNIIGMPQGPTYRRPLSMLPWRTFPQDWRKNLDSDLLCTQMTS